MSYVLCACVCRAFFILLKTNAGNSQLENTVKAVKVSVPIEELARTSHHTAASDIDRTKQHRTPPIIPQHTHHTAFLAFMSL